MIAPALPRTESPVPTVVPRPIARPALQARINPWLLAALGLAVLFHGALLLAGSYQRTYDAYIHIFFADHYARDWFATWEPRWYTGFSVVSYPPGAQQAVALLSFAIGLLHAFMVVQLGAVLLLITGIYRFARLWVSEEAAGYAALIAVVSSSIAETVHVFGQLPTIFALAFLLNGLPYLCRWLDEGRWRDLAATLILFAATTAGHHVTTIFGAVLFAGPVAVDVFVWRFERRPIGKLSSLRPFILRTMALGAGILGVTLFVVLPYWLWSRSDPITQIPIPHASRDSFITNVNAGLVFWVVPWGVLLIVVPYAFWKGITTRLWPLALSLGVATLLGTGGTTPLPKLLLGGAYEVLTLDRFTFWATILVLPFAGEFVRSLRRGQLATILRAQIGDRLWRALQPALVVALIVAAVLTTNLTQFRQFQPDPIDMKPITDFISKDEHWRWRYLTLGFGDQMAWLAAQTTATTVDGDYHSARRLPELTTTPVERLEGAKYSGVPGIGSLQQFLAVPEKYNLKYVFSNDQFYDPLLFFSGWQRVDRLQNGIVVWERADIAPLPNILPTQEIPRYQRLLWGVLPITAILAALVVLSAGLWYRRAYRFAAILGLDEAAARLRRSIPFRIPSLADDASAPIAATRWLARRWGAVIRWQGAMERRRPLTVPSRAIRVLLVVLTLFLVVAPGAVYAYTRDHSPEATVAAYYNDLDFRRFDDAYARLDPATRPSLDEYLLGLSVQGGLLASYAELDSIETRQVKRESDYAVVEADASWVTSLKRYDETQRYALVKRDGSWYIDLDTTVEPLPPDEFFHRPEVNWASQGRRALTTGKTDLADILDRPQIHVLSSRLVENDGLYSVVGEVINLDVDPADITVTAVVNDASGAELTRYNAQSVAIHKVLPKETVPFRIDFEGVAGLGEAEPSGAITFEPGERFPVAADLWSRAAGFQVYAKAVVTGQDLGRDVGAQDLTVSAGPDGDYALAGTLLNSGTVEAIVPHVVVTYYGADGAVSWVSDGYLDSSIRPQRARAFSLSLTNPTTVRTVIPSGQNFANGLVDQPSTGSTNALLPLPAETGYTALRVSVNYLTGAES